MQRRNYWLSPSLMTETILGRPLCLTVSTTHSLTAPIREHDPISAFPEARPSPLLQYHRWNLRFAPSLNPTIPRHLCQLWRLPQTLRSLPPSHLKPYQIPLRAHTWEPRHRLESSRSKYSFLSTSWDDTVKTCTLDRPSSNFQGACILGVFCCVKPTPRWRIRLGLQRL